MNDDDIQSETHPLPKDLFIFSPTGGIVMNIDHKSLPPPANGSSAKFELIGTNPLVKTNKTSNFSEYDHYIEDPTNPEIKNAVLNNIAFVDGKMSLKKDAVDIIYCSFEVFRDSQKFDLTASSHIAFYVNMLQIYSPELKHNTLTQYFTTLMKVLENNLVSLDSKYLLTNKSLEVEWEKCNFGKYSLFRNFFTAMKKFFKMSPLYMKPPFFDQATSNAYQELLYRTINGRALAMLKNIADSEDPLKLLMLFKAVEWVQKLESLKVTQAINSNYLFKAGKDKQAVEFLKQMFGKAPVVAGPHEVIDGEGVVPEEKQAKAPESGTKVINGKPKTNAGGAGLEAPANKNAAGSRRRSSEYRNEDISAKIKVNPPAKGKKKEESPAPPEVDRKKKEVQQQQQQQEKKEEKKQEESSKKAKRVKTERINLFFELLDKDAYQEDYGGRICNFLKKAIKMGYEYLPTDQGRIETIISKFKKHFNDDQRIDVSRSYQKFCLDYNIDPSEKILSYLESEVQSSTFIKEVKIKEETSFQTFNKQNKNVEKVVESPKRSNANKQKENELSNLDNKLEGKKYNEKVSAKVNNQEQTVQVNKNETKASKEKDGHEEKEQNIIHCKNVNPMAEQIQANQRLFDNATRIQDNLERILNKKFPFLKVSKIGSIGYGSATKFTDNFNMLLVRKDLLATVEESKLIEDVFNFLTENYFLENSNQRIETKFGKPTIIFKDHKDTNLKCSIIYDNENTYRDITQKIKLFLSAQPSILNVFYKLQEDLSKKNLLSHDGLSSYLLLIMLITSCQMEFEGKKCLQGLQDKNIQLSHFKIYQKELLKRFTTIFHSCIQNEASKNYYFSLLRGCLDQISESRPDFAKDDCIVYLEDPFLPHVNCTKKLNPSRSQGIIDFIEELYATYGI